MVSAILLAIYFLSIGSHLLLWFVYVRQYRFASLIFDLLPFYPIFIFLYLAIQLAIFNPIGSSSNALLRLSGIVYYIIVIFQLVVFYNWARIYSIRNYELFLNDIRDHSNLRIMNWNEIDEDLSGNPELVTIIIRHDVDINPSRTKKMLELENSMNIDSCYFFRVKATTYKFDEILPLIENYRKSNQITFGFHYASITNAGGSLEMAPSVFKQEVTEFREFYNIRFVTGHGDKNRNRRLITENLVNLEELNLVSAYDLYKTHYISEAGGLRKVSEQFGSTNINAQLNQIKHLDNGSVVQILIHPDWWFKHIWIR